MWRSQFEADPKIIGSSIALDMRPYTVVGVMPAEFRTPFFDQADQLWIPLVQDPLFSGWMTHPPQTHWMAVFARLRPGVSFVEAKAEMDTMTARLAKEFPEEKGWQIQQVQPLQQAIVGDVKSPLLIYLVRGWPGAADCVREYCELAADPCHVSLEGNRSSRRVGRS
jgi:putative ABC transport system permease protein